MLTRLRYKLARLICKRTFVSSEYKNGYFRSNFMDTENEKITMKIVNGRPIFNVVDK
jgi:hypothetical protein